MSMAMDMYFNVNESSISLQEMLDIDLKSEVDCLVGGHNDLSGFNFSDLPALEMDDNNEARWFSTNSNHSNSNFSFDLGLDPAAAMVNPNAVMPVISLTQNVRSPSPSMKESHLTFSPGIKFSSIKMESSSVKKDLMSKLNGDVVEEKKPVLKTITKVTPIVSKPVVKTITRTPTLLSFKNTVQRQLPTPITVTQINNLSAMRTLSQRKQQFSSNNRMYDEDIRIYPKPAYSYSCLIAMALKNSRSGSLPVSEIYNFMCKHFPYFKTAPTGWKNSVRHNLSLNKCFEKIEKPAINGSQRKGCLWAMNPLKIGKMDEEVQKWSRKDPSAIRKAMTNPENLEALERGDLKFNCSFDEIDNFGDSCGSAESGEESENEVENVLNAESEFVEIHNVKNEQDDVGEEFDVEVNILRERFND